MFISYFSEILPQASLKQETKNGGKGQEIFYKKATEPWNI